MFKRELLTQPQVQTGSHPLENDEQLSLPRVLLLHLGPGICMVLFNWLITPWLIERGDGVPP